MIYIIDESLGVVQEINRAVDHAAAGDTIITPTIPAYNKTIRLLGERRPDVMIYVRMSTVEYFPAIKDEKLYGSDNIPALYNIPPESDKPPS